MSLKSLFTSLIFYLLFFITPLVARVDFTLEHATTLAEKSWGLMGRTSIPENYGLLIHYPEKEIVHIWMFNCYFDLTVAFIDENHHIRELHDLKAFPEKMDPLRPVKNLSDLIEYPYHDPITRFFRIRTVKSSSPISYVLEMNKGWFQKNNIKVNDVVYWDLNKGYIVRNIHE